MPLHGYPPRLHASKTPTGNIDDMLAPLALLALWEVTGDAGEDKLKCFCLFYVTVDVCLLVVCVYCGFVAIVFCLLF